MLTILRPEAPLGIRREDGAHVERWRRSTLATSTTTMTTNKRSAFTRRKRSTVIVAASLSAPGEGGRRRGGGGGGGRGKAGGGAGAREGSASEIASQMQQEALDSQTKLRLAKLRAVKEEERAIHVRATELEKEMAIRAEGRRRAEEIGGRRPTQRRSIPIAVAGLQCGALSIASFLATQRAATALTDYETPIANKTLILNLTVGGGVALSSLLVISTIILFTVALKEGLGVVNDTPVTFYRCDGVGPACCKNGPHNMGYAEKFVYLSNGRGFETRQKDSMRRHLLVSRKCRELRPIVIYPKEEGWELW